MRLPPIQHSPSGVQLVLALGEYSSQEYHSGDRIEGQVLRMVDNNAEVLVGESVVTLRSNIPLLPGQVVLQVEEQFEGEWHLRLLSNEPSQYLLQEQIGEMRLQSDSSRETLLKAFLGEFPVDREIFLQAEQLWKSVERNPAFLQALVLLFKNGDELSEAALRAMQASLLQSDIPGWLEQQAIEMARELLQEWGIVNDFASERLLSTLLISAPGFAESDFSLSSWLISLSDMHAESLPYGAADSNAPLPSGQGDIDNAIGSQTNISTNLPYSLSESTAHILSPSLHQSVNEVIAAGSGSGVLSSMATSPINSPNARVSTMALLSTEDRPLASVISETLPSSEVAATQSQPGRDLFLRAMQIWSDTGHNSMVLLPLLRLVNSTAAIVGKNLLLQIAEQESRVNFAALDLSEAEMGDKRALLRQMNLGESAERLLLLQRLYLDSNTRISRDELLQAEKLWRSLGGKERDLQLVARTLTTRLPTEIPSVWALQLAEENRWQNALAYLWLQMSDPPVLEEYQLPKGSEEKSQPSSQSAPLAMIGFQTERLGPVLITLTTRGRSGYGMELSIAPLWQRQVEREALEELVPLLKTIVPNLRFWVSTIKETDVESKKAKATKRRFDIRV